MTSVYRVSWENSLRRRKTFWAEKKVRELGYGKKYALPFHHKQSYSEGKLHEANRRESVPAGKRHAPFPSQATEMNVGRESWRQYEKQELN